MVGRVNGANMRRPEKFSVDWLDDFDQRSRIARILKARLVELYQDCGSDPEGNELSVQQRMVCQRLVFIEAQCADMELALALHKADPKESLKPYHDSISQMVNLIRLLGIKRQKRPPKNIRDVVSKYGTNDS